MKRLRLLLLSLLIVGSVSAQRRTVEHNPEDNTVKITRVIPKRVDMHDFRVGVGTGSFVTGLFLDKFLMPGTEVDYENKTSDRFDQNLAQADTYLTDAYFTGVYSLSYTYHSRRWFQFGATATFAAVTQSRRNSIDNSKIEDRSDYAVAVMPTARFVYLYREKVQLYSSVSLGVVFSEEVVPWVDFTLIGCTFGRKLFGFAELGCGIGGFGRIGIGYRFDAARKGKK